jgi:hypothetical protein
VPAGEEVTVYSTRTVMDNISSFVIVFGNFVKLILDITENER